MATRIIKSGRMEVQEAQLLWSHAPQHAAPVIPISEAGQIDFATNDAVHAAHRLGRQEGEAAAREAELAFHAQLQELVDCAANMADLRSGIIRTAHKDLLQLAVAIARRILHRELLLSEDVLQGIIAANLEKLQAQDVNRLRVHPTLLDRVEAILSSRPKNRRPQVVADASLQPGGCVFETMRGNVDAGIESQLAEIDRGLADHLAESY